MAVEINLNAILAYTLWGNSVRDYVLALAAFFVVISVLKILKYKVIKSLQKFAKRTKSEFDDFLIGIIDDIGWPFYVLLSVYAALYFVQVPDIAGKVMYYAVLIAGTYYVFMGIHHIIDYGTKRVIKKKEEQEADASAIHLMGKILKLAVWVIAVLLILSNLGYDITTLIAGLGIGGVAIAFALQNILKDIFASFSIYFDKPFQEGDFIIVGDDKGVVKHIGIKSTRIKTLEGQELVMTNKELTDARVNNYKKMEKRRVVLKFGIIYQTPVKKLKKIPSIMDSIIGKVEHAELDRVHFKEFGNSSLVFDVVYYIDTKDYKMYRDIHQEICLKLMEKFEKERIGFAYPTQTVFLEKAKK